MKVIHSFLFGVNLLLTFIWDNTHTKEGGKNPDAILHFEYEPRPSVLRDAWADPLSEPVAPYNKESTMAKLKLRPVDHGQDRNRYCGPSVISAVTNLTTGEAARLIRIQSGKRSVKGTSTQNVRRALEACNISMIWTPAPAGSRYGKSSGVTLARWLKLTHGTRAERVFLIVAGHHWQLVSGNRYVCGVTVDIVSIKDKKVKRRERVSEVYDLISDGVKMPDIDVSKPKSKTNALRYQCQKLIKQHPQFEMTIERENYSGDPDGNFWWVQMSDDLENLAEEMKHELSDCHGCYCYEEILDRLQRMVEFGKEHYKGASEIAA